ncbi:lysophospholipase phospholipase B plb1-Penicillium chrysogenum [Penicillium samsonianum]|uniref:lysophospholipase phospholipase B plb1-Penicillium chrysogenum n=1 Tax=Penicillium samsonianum TaxID=1882272 RepID=UPI0025489569|nr:lysophospholipase phospholipase B plb1-Penicillium chrysogenum [Penicillium samsonianum]KAJ6138229.1 lysophospholipase phospholipase B plb1-Penicillium chrysogenum [Penicillium samsonianum]
MNIWRTYQQNYPGTLSKLPAGPVHKYSPSVHKYHPLVHGNSFLSTFFAQLLVGHNCDLTVMKTFALFSIALGLPGAIAVPGGLNPDDITFAGVQRALPNAPDGYVPTSVSCPANRPAVRSAAKLSSNETSWLEVRRGKTLSAMKDFFGHVKVGDYDVGAYLDKHSGNSSSLPNIGIAVSGGGWRALMNGAGAVKAFDNRTSNASATGHLGGLLQSATYISGLSGGSWLLGSIYINNFTTIDKLQTHTAGSVWQFGNSILEGPDTGGIQLLDSASYLKDIADAVDGKRTAGFDTSLTDIWGRALSYQMFNATNGGVSYTWSSIADTPEFKDGDYPLPFVVADGRNPGELVIGSNSTVYEFNPWEFGTFDPTIFGFVPLKYLGSKFEGGSLPSNESCISGFDNAGFVIGTSSTLFNQFLLQINTTSLPSFVKDTNRKTTSLPLFALRRAKILDVVDGGEDGQNVPLHPLIQPERQVDVIFAVDSSADTDYFWPNGTSLVATYERSLNSSGIGNGTAFPAVPDQNTFINLGLSTRPSFFGCNSSNQTGPSPLVVYIPNAPYSYHSNISTFQLSTDDTQRDQIILNGYEVATMANSTLDGNWTSCVGCAILSRSFERTGTTLPDICNQCFDRYCWNGTVNSTRPHSYNPAYYLADSMASVILPTILSTVVAASLAMLILV